MKSVFNTLFAVLAGACAALLVLKYAAPPTDAPEFQTQMRSYAPPPSSGSQPGGLPDANRGQGRRGGRL